MSIGRIIKCLLGMASPSRVAMLAVGPAPAPRTWLERWERRIDERVQWPPVIVEREEVQVINAGGAVLKRVDVTDRSDRAQRRVLNREKRRAAKVGAEARMTRVFETPAST
jgi:hypothetical protein